MLTEKDLSRNRFYYIIEAAVEYFISLLITGAFLATLLTRSGVSDAATGVITQLASLAFTAQLFSVFFRKTRGMKRFVTIMHVVNQLMFVSLYMIPTFQVPPAIKTTCFVVLFLGGHLVSNIVSPYKLSWLMSFVPNNRRGRFTASKEIVSLLGGMVFSMAMGALIDYTTAAGKEDLGFTLCGITILVLAGIHFLTLVLIRDHEPDPDAVSGHVSLDTVKKTVTNTVILKIIAVDIIWHLATGIAVSYYGVYQTGDLGFSLRYASFVSILSSLSRVAVSRLFGKIADKYSWTRLLTMCFAIAALSFGVNIFTVPSNGHVMFVIYSCIHAMSMAGINGGLMNIIFDFVPQSERPAALGIKYSVGGLAGFFASLVGSVIVTTIQKNGNTFLGMPLYAQQLLSVIALVICIVLVIYMRVVIAKLKANKSE